MSLPVFTGGAVHVLPEHPVKIADVVVAAAGGDGADGFRAGEQLITGETDAVIVDVFHEGHVYLGFEKTAELPFAHMKSRRKSFKSQDGTGVFLNELKDFFLSGGSWSHLLDKP